MEKMLLTYERLNGEYLDWALRYGENRNEDDLRFGQYLNSKYSMVSFNDVFYFEDYESVYSSLLNDLYKKIKIKDE
jgi:hypothetical protein